MDRAKETGKRCLAQEISFLAPSTTCYLMYAQKLGASLPFLCSFPSLPHVTKGKCQWSHQQSPGGDHLGTQRPCSLFKGVLLGGRNRCSSTVRGPSYYFHFQETKNWRNRFPVSAVSLDGACAGGGRLWGQQARGLMRRPHDPHVRRPQHHV